MQFKAQYHEFRIFMALRPSNYLVGILSRPFRCIYIPKLGYLINDADLAKTILKDKEHFSGNESGGIGTLISQLSEVPTLLSMEGDAHHSLKFGLLDLFSQESLQKHIGKDLEAITEELVTQLKNGESLDMAAYARYVTNRITAKVLGVHADDKAALLNLSEIITAWMGSIDLKYQQIPALNLEKANPYSKKLIAVAKQYYDDPEVDEDCIIKRLKHMGYSFEEAKGFIIMFIVAGTVTVSSSLPRIIALLVDTNSFAQLQQNPEAVQAAIDEGLRYVSPGPVVLHGVKQENNTAQYHFKANRRVVILMYNILHSKSYSEHAGTFDISRIQNPLVQNLWFGAGVHFCMGSVLARMEIETMLKALLGLDGQLQIVKRHYRRNGIYPSYQELSLKLVNQPR